MNETTSPDLTIREVDRDSNARTGFNEPAEVGHYELIHNDTTRYVVMVKVRQFRRLRISDPEQWVYECWAFEADHTWQQLRQRAGHVFHFSTADEVTWEDLEAELRESAYRVIPDIW